MNLISMAGRSLPAFPALSRLPPLRRYFRPLACAGAVLLALLGLATILAGGSGNPGDMPAGTRALAATGTQDWGPAPCPARLAPVATHVEADVHCGGSSESEPLPSTPVSPPTGRAGCQRVASAAVHAGSRPWYRRRGGAPPRTA